MPKLHIIAVAYEKQIPLRGLIDSLLIQTNENWKLDIVHDGPASDSYIKFLVDTYGLVVKKNRITKEIRITGKFTFDIRLTYNESEKRYHTKERPTWGHPNRAAMLKKLKGDPNDYVLITNDDNYYVPLFIEYFMGVTGPDVGIVYCDTVHSHSGYLIHYSKLKEQGIDMGAFIVRLDIAQQTGFNHVHFSADGAYAEECNNTRINKGLKAVYIPKCLFIHN